MQGQLKNQLYSQYELSIIGKRKFKNVTVYNGFQKCLGINLTEHVQRLRMLLKGTKDLNR